MSTPLNRRSFLASTAAGGVALGWTARSWSQDATPSRRVRVGVMGMSRGSSLARGFSQRPGVEVAYVCDVDQNRLEKAVGAVEQVAKVAPAGVTDFRRILDDPTVDAVVIATPNHWHAPATIMACAAGKHVYVEKPGSHNSREAEMMIAAAREHDRKVQVGFQRRSWPILQEAMQRLREGVIGEVRLVRSWYNSLRGPLSPGVPANAPDGLDWDLWQGPAPRVPYRTHLVHYNWHWFWHWGNGELGNNGCHGLDLCVWGLDAMRQPQQVTAGGGIFFLNDNQETPDTLQVNYDYGDQMISWDGRSAHLRGYEGSRFGAAFFGTQGTLVITGPGYAIYEMRDKLIDEQQGSGGDAPHFDNFLAAIRDGEPLNGEVEICQQSPRLCHLGSIAYRLGRTLHCDPESGHIQDDPEAMAWWGREYEPGWEPQIAAET